MGHDDIAQASLRIAALRPEDIEPHSGRGEGAPGGGCPRLKRLEPTAVVAMAAEV